MSQQPEKFEPTSACITDGQKAKLKSLLPEIVTEGGKIDFDRLRLTLGEAVDAGKERYGMNWPGKAECFKTIQRPSMATLVPARDESVNFETTENLIIEGDNLEALKLLQKAYLGKVKMIYVDPPYNTGNDFIYPDDFSETLETYLRYTGQVDAEGRKFSTNTEADGRFHSKWMNMMYPRLFLARNLLREDGIIFVSIDYRELENLRRIMNEVFGEENLVGVISVVSNWKGRSDDKYIATANEFLLSYQKGKFESLGLPLTEEYLASYTEKETDGRIFRLLGLRKRGAGAKREDRPNMFYPFFVDTGSGAVSLQKNGPFSLEVLPRLSDGTDGRWRWGKATSAENVNGLIARKVSGADRWDVFEKDYAESAEGMRRIKPKSVWTDKEVSNEAGTLEYKELMGKISFDNPKPTGLLRLCLAQATKDDDIALDFFAGSGTTAQAVLEANKEEGGNRKFILVQLPEPTEHEDFPTIADITKERVRRVIKKLNDEEGGKLGLEKGENPDRGFKVFKLQSSNFKAWSAEQPKDDAELGKQLTLHVDHLVAGRTQDDVLYELLLKSGFPLNTKVEKITMAGKIVFSIADGTMLICLEMELTPEVIKTMAENKPERVVCLDAGFANNDQLKTNAVQTMKAKGVTKFQTV